MTFIIAVAMLAVVAVLFLGLRNLMRGGSASTSNKLMQLRVLVQALAIVLIVIAVFVGRHT